jgi:hypothetical protein
MAELPYKITQKNPLQQKWSEQANISTAATKSLRNVHLVNLLRQLIYRRHFVQQNEAEFSSGYWRLYPFSCSRRLRH